MKEKRSEEYEVLEEVFDRSTLMVIYDFLNKGVIDEIHGVVKAGKESRVYWGKDKQGNELAIKIYLTVSAEFRKGMWKYIEGDPRFKGVKRDTRSLVFAWAQKEFRNLEQATMAKVRVPKPIAVKNNVLIMEFIGEDGIPAPRLKDIKLTSREYEEALKKIVEYITILYRNAELVHSDLSEYNVLWWNEPVLIDLSQAVLISHPLSQEFLVRDLKNILKYFSNEGVRTPTLEEVYHRVTGEKPPWKPGNT